MQSTEFTAQAHRGLGMALPEALSALALRHGVRISARDLHAQRASFAEQGLDIASAVEVLRRLGFVLDLGPVSRAQLQSSGEHAACLLGLPDATALLVLQVRQGQWLVQDAQGPARWVSESDLGQAGQAWGVRVLAYPQATAADLPAQGGHWFWSAFKLLRSHYLDSTVAAILINLLALAGSMFTMNVYDRVIPNAAMHSLWVLAIGVSLAALIEGGLRILRGYLVDEAGKKADLQLSARIFRHVLNLRLQDRPGSSGQFAGQLREFESVRDFVSSTTLVALSDLPFVFLFLAVIAFLGGPLVWVPLSAAVLVLVISAASQWPIRRAIERYQYESAHKHGFLVDAVQRLEQVRALGAEPQLQGQWERLSAVTARSAMDSRLTSSVTTHLTQFVQQGANTALIIGGVYLILQGHMTTGALIGCSILSGRVMGPMSQVAGLLTRYQHAASAWRVMNRIMGLPGIHEPGRTRLGLERARGELEVRQLAYAYAEGLPVVCQIAQLRVAAGEHVAIMGPVGSGKSTLLKVLSWLYPPQQGQVLLDGLDVSQIAPADLRAQLAWVSQDAVLFRGSLRENLLMASPQVSDAALTRVLQLTGMDQWIAAHPHGLDMPLAEGGGSLSGGQRQMVALARALLADSPVLLLDEPTSAFDAVGEQRLLERLRPALQGRTVIVATHRPGPLALVSRLILLDGGQVVADGPRDEVLRAVQQGQIQRAPGRAAA